MATKVEYIYLVTMKHAGTEIKFQIRAKDQTYNEITNTISQTLITLGQETEGIVLIDIMYTGEAHG
jgi:hypothetical protein